jgi:ribonuclease E
MKKEMLINVLQPEECRIAIVEDGVLEELYVERASQESYVGNIYKGKIVNIEVGIQAAFVDFGIGRNGFLHVTDVDPVYYKHLLPKEMLDDLNDMERDDRPRGGGRRGDRGPRRHREEPEQAPREMTTFLPPDPLPEGGTLENNGFSEDISEEVEEVGGFLDGLDDTPPAPPPVRRMPIQVTNVAPPPVVTRSPEPERQSKLGTTTPPPLPHRADADDEEDGFASGLDEEPERPLVSGRKPAKADEEEAEPFFDPVADTEGDIPDVEGDTPPADGEGEGESETPKKKPRTGTKKAGTGKKTGKPKADDKKSAKPKKPTKKKDDGDGPKSKPMESAERRTDDDEPEIRPFFEDESGGFDVDAPNDRFAGSPPAKEEGEENGFATVEGEESEGAEPAPDSSGFSDADFAELDAATERRFQENERGDRGGRGGPRGDRGGRGGRDRDRGPRGDRGDRGPRGGGYGGGGGGGGFGGGGGDRGGPRGPMPGKAHTRHKGLPIPPIQEIFKRGQEVIVQVIKEGIGTKGPTLSTFISIAGRYLVLMPSLTRVGVSKKIEDRDTRRRLRDIMDGLNPPEGVGFIVRTAAVDRDETELRNDLVYLLRLWQVVVRRIKRPGPVEVYRESDMITRTIRDIFTADIDTIWVDEEKAFAHASEFLQIVMPKYAGRIRYHGETEPLFHRFRIDDEIARINQKRVEMPGGGSLIIEQTEALVSIDVNSGNFRAEGNAEETAFQMNLKAAKEIARQLRLRDLGGVIVNDFIDMRAEHHRRQVEDTLKNALRRDKARTKTLRVSEFGIIEMTRQRMQPSLKKRIYNDCPHCAGTGYVKTNETMGIEVMRALQLAAHRCPGGSTLTVTVCAEVASYLLNRKRKDITALEARASMEVTIEGKFGASPDLCELKCIDSNGVEVRLNPGPGSRGGRFGPPPAGPAGYQGGGGSGGHHGGGHGNGGGRRYQD